MAWRTLLARIVDTINAIAALVCHALLVIITSVTVLQVFLRYVLNRPTSWSEEIALFGLIWFGLLAVAIGVRRHEHVAITFLRDMSPPLLATALDYLAQLCIIVFMFVVMFYGHDLITLAGVQVLPASRLAEMVALRPDHTRWRVGHVQRAWRISCSKMSAYPNTALRS